MPPEYRRGIRGYTAQSDEGRRRAVRGCGQGRPGCVGDNEPRGGSAGWRNQRRLRLRRERPELELRPVFSVARLRLSSLDEAALSLPAGAASR